MRFLASDDLQGRSPGTGGLERAAEYIGQRWQSLGLDTKIFGNQPYQKFTIPGSETVADLTNNSLRIEGGGRPGEQIKR